MGDLLWLFIRALRQPWHLPADPQEEQRKDQDLHRRLAEYAGYQDWDGIGVLRRCCRRIHLGIRSWVIVRYVCANLMWDSS